MADADSLEQRSVSDEVLLRSKREEMPPQPQQDEEMKNNESGEEYSSGSDRSLEADNHDDLRFDQNTVGTTEGQILPARIRSKKRRHGSHGSRRQKGGSRHKHRSFQPYPDTGELENTLKRKSLELQEKENAAAVLRQEGGGDQFITFPVAPFNSTQFLMDEHNVDSPNTVSKLENSNSKLAFQDVALSSLPSTPMNEMDELEPLKDNEFSDIYSTVHAENLQSMPKSQLVRHYMSLEEQVVSLQKKVAEAEQRNVNSESSANRKECESEKDCVPGSDTNSLSSGNEEFVDISSMNASVIDRTSSKEEVIQSV